MVFWLSIFGMICWGIAPVFAKVGLSNVNPLPGLIIRTLMASVFVASLLGVNDNFNQIKSLSFNALVLIGIEALLATLVGDLAYYAAIKKGNISVVTTIMASSPLVTMLVSTLFLGEELTPTRIFGAALIIFGIMIVSIK
ncbi:putative transporter, EamA-like family [Gottschalkia acidurici 9a]|uniref:Transporter, EamA-like family n=1 Tax=Gottschalkia acidurici (strain ATCC 7906 / DSM 604 / BCRC 14475 / CIP 104303 / KCTC 5404 / NCIMB 10678 / 9a) TaxID=1128398 RepID=K0B1D4_GOTA9|nr:EamA family transporter [Gottschalkia acidurici]AFS78775.1 putative transporter, EamA-like family [Gottschalkia acidurici 9a]